VVEPKVREYFSSFKSQSRSLSDNQKRGEFDANPIIVMPYFLNSFSSSVLG